MLAGESIHIDLKDHRRIAITTLNVLLSINLKVKISIYLV